MWNRIKKSWQETTALANLERELKHSDEKHRLQAVETAKQIGGEKLIKYLRPLLADPAEQVQRAAREALAEQGAVEVLLEKGSISEEEMREIKALLIRAGKNNVEPLITSLDNSKMDYKFYEKCILLVEVLGQLKNPLAVDVLTKALNSRQSGLPNTAAKALEEIGDDRAKDALVAALSNQYGAVSAALALSNLGDDRGKEIVIAALDGQNSPERRLATKEVGRFGDERAIQPLVHMLTAPVDVTEYESAGATLQQLQWQPSSEDQRAILSVALRNWSAVQDIGSAAIEPLKKVLILGLSERSYPLGEASETLGKIRVESLFDLLGKADAAVLAGCKKLGEAVIDPLIELLINPGFYVREFAQKTLIELNWEAKNDIEKARWMVGNGESKWKDNIEYDESYIEPFVYVVNHWSVGARMKAARILHTLGWTAVSDVERIYSDITSTPANFPVHPLAVAPLLWVIHNKSKDIAQQAADALETILDRYPDQVEKDTLQGLVDLSRTYNVQYNDICGIDRERFEDVEYPHLRQLARQALIRRGKKA